MSQKHLFQLANFGGFEEHVGMSTFGAFSQTNDYSAPVCVPVGTKPSDFMDYKKLDQKLIRTIDVVNNFDWTLTPGHARGYDVTESYSSPGVPAKHKLNDIPYIRMSEYNLNFNSLIQNLKYLINSGLEGLEPTSALVGRVAKAAAKKADKASGGAGSRAVESGTDAAFDLLLSISDFLGIDMEKAGEDVVDLIGRLNIDQKHVPYYLRPYNGLYGVRPSGFRYILPYFTSEWKTVRSAWGDIQGGSALGTLLSLPQKIAGGIIETAGTMKTGAYFERPKSYELPVEGEAITFNFPLYNTRSFEEVTKNFEFVFLLAYQQLANKTSKVLLDPPVIYEVEVPGQFYSPYAYIANLSIEGKGAKRKEKINFKSIFDDKTDQEAEGQAGRPKHNAGSSDTGAKNGQSKEVKNLDCPPNGNEVEVDAIIPEMWDVTITLQSLIPHTKNLFYHSVIGESSLYDVKIEQGPGQAARDTQTLNNFNANIAAARDRTAGTPRGYSADINSPGND